MPIIKCGNIFTTKFGNREEPRFEIALGGLPVTYSVIRPNRNIQSDDKYKLSLQLTEEQYREIQAALMVKLLELNVEGGYGATEKQIRDQVEQILGESTVHEGTYRFFGSKKMGYANKETGEMEPAHMPVYDGKISEDTLISGGVSLGAGSVVRSVFIVSMFKRDKKVFLNMNPSKVVVINKVDPPKRESISHDGLDDVYDY